MLRALTTGIVRTSLLISLLAALATGLPAQDFYVDAGVSTSGNGKTWPGAFKTLQEALAVAQSGQKIWVTKGNYAGGFAIPPGVEVYGNFVSGDTRPSQRVVLNSTGTTLDGKENTRVLTAGTGAILDSLTILRGKAGAPGGGGALCEGTSPTFRYCIFGYNNTTGRGSALYVVNNSKGVKANPTLEGCLFFQNGLKSGGGIHNIDVCNSNATFRNVGVADNQDNGLHFHQGSNVSILNCYFVRNSGRGVCHIDAGSTAVLENNHFWKNTVSMMHHQGSELRTIAAVNALGYAKNNITGDPLFPPLHYNQAKGSPLIDSGQNLAALAQTDFSGMGRRLDSHHTLTAIVDIGPREFSPNRIQVAGTPSPGQTITMTIAGPAGLPTIMGIGLTPAPTGFYLDPLGYFFLDGSKPVIYTAWDKTGSSRPLTIPANWPKGTTICFQNLAMSKGASLSNLYDLRIR